MYRMLTFCHKLKLNHSKRIAILDENDAITHKQVYVIFIII